MTIEQALAHVDADVAATLQILSDLQTVKALQGLGEGNKAVELYAQTRYKARKAFAEMWDD